MQIIRVYNRLNSVFPPASTWFGAKEGLMNMIPFDPSFDPDRPSCATDAPRTAVVSSAALLADGKLVHIQHRGELYSLRETRLGKLILTK